MMLVKSVVCEVFLTWIKKLYCALVIAWSEPTWIWFHYRTSSLPNFFGSFVTQQQHSTSSSKEASPSVSLTQAGSDPQQFLVTKPPPQYEEATKQLKVKQVSNKHVGFEAIQQWLLRLFDNHCKSLRIFEHFFHSDLFTQDSYPVHPSPSMHIPICLAYSFNLKMEAACCSVGHELWDAQGGG
jgi:hypothetical protein